MPEACGGEIAPTEIRSLAAIERKGQDISTTLDPLSDIFHHLPNRTHRFHFTTSILSELFAFASSYAKIAIAGPSHLGILRALHQWAPHTRSVLIIFPRSQEFWSANARCWGEVPPWMLASVEVLTVHGRQKDSFGDLRFALPGALGFEIDGFYCWV